MKSALWTFLFLSLFLKTYCGFPITIEKNPPFPISETPQLPIEVYSEEFAKILGTKPQLVHLADGLGKIRMPKETANLTFGGKENNILFICSSDSLWAIKLNTPLTFGYRQKACPIKTTAL